MMNSRELWSFLCRVLSQGGAIQMDYNAGKYESYEHYSARLDEAARERADELEAALPPAMTWTKVAPKEVGHYWYKRRCDSRDVIEIVEVRDRGYLYAGNHGPVLQLHGEWAGPIAPPMEPPQ